MNPIPNDICLEIFSRLPAKSVGRFRCVSKLWDSMLQHPYFTKLFLSRSPARPRLLFAIHGFGEREFFFFSLPLHQIRYDNSSSPVIAADFHMKLPGDMCTETWCYASGLMYFPNMWNAKKGEDRVNVICNPSTRLCADLPEMRMDKDSRSFLGFDPIDKQFKVLFLAHPSCDDDHRILTLGTGNSSWRKINCPLPHTPSSKRKGICINGVLYYLAHASKIVCFDVRSEKFKFIDGKSNGVRFTKLVNYKGKLGVIIKYATFADTKFTTCAIELRMWVLEDVEKQEWSEHAFTLKGDEIVGFCDDYDVGVTAYGDIVLLSSHHPCGSFCVFFFNPERNSLQRVEFRGKHEALHRCNNIVYAFENHEEDLEFNVMETTYAATSSNPQLRGTFESMNKFDALCLSDDD
ncbi:unnamed protein product [Microthlaspi erraticum]|uniref:F-box domain-containing protein n=1 Tax=Microthlaspi erraticum TaxID=1685480 RepID=A0A6D2LDN0_9BRAS|nr:unnamed protein product [Microthlaspi erraticum]